MPLNFAVNKFCDHVIFSITTSQETCSFKSMNNISNFEVKVVQKSFCYCVCLQNLINI